MRYFFNKRSLLTFFAVRLTSVGILLLLVIASCNSNKNSNTANDSVAQTNEGTSAQLAPLAMSGVLDTLFVDGPTFTNLPAGKLVLQYYIGQTDTLTLHGWSTKTTGGFNTPPTIRLLKGRQSPLKYGPGSYFGDLVLTNAEINTVQKALKKNKSKYVLFAPEMDGVHIKYHIYVSTDDPFATIKQFFSAPINTNMIANPSPPRNF